MRKNKICQINIKKLKFYFRNKLNIIIILEIEPSLNPQGCHLHIQKWEINFKRKYYKWKKILH